jgi:hypothetical protein
MTKPDYDTTIARIAGNVAAAFAKDGREEWVAARAVAIAEAIVARLRQADRSKTPDPAE